MIHITQCLCERRHAILALSWDDTIEDLCVERVIASFKEVIATAIHSRAIDPWCALCGSRIWHYEDGVTRWETMEEAKPHLEKLERANMETAQFLRGGKN